MWSCKNSKQNELNLYKAEYIIFCCTNVLLYHVVSTTERDGRNSSTTKTIYLLYNHLRSVLVQYDDINEQ